MKMNQFRSILAIATVATSITASSLPSQAFTWDDLWQSVKRGYENAQPSHSSPQPSNDSDNNFTSQQEEANENGAPMETTNSVIRQDDLTFQPLGCKKESGYGHDAILNCYFKIIYVGNDEMQNFQITSARAFSAIDDNQYNHFTTMVAGQSSVEMIKGQPIRGVISFMWSPALKNISLLEFQTNNTSRKISIR
jgi:hypothetical protein